MKKLTVYPETGPELLLTWTTNGWNSAPICALWSFPLTMAIPLGVGPVGVVVIVSVKNCVNAPATAVTVAVPAVVPAVTLTDA